MLVIHTLVSLTLLAASGTASAAVDDRHDIVLAETPEGCVVYVDGTDLVVEGCNLVVRNGMGSTSTTNGTGNLVVGYDEVTRWDDKSGSHNVVVGPGPVHRGQWRQQQRCR